MINFSVYFFIKKIRISKDTKKVYFQSAQNKNWTNVLKKYMWGKSIFGVIIF